MPSVIYLIYLVPLSLSAMFSLKSFRLNWPRPYKFFSIFLLFTLAIEIFAVTWKIFLFKALGNNYSDSNLWIYNIYLIPEYMFYFLLYYSFLKTKIVKKAFVLLCLSYLCFAICNLFWIQSLYNLNSYTIISGNILVILMSLNYFNQSLNDRGLKRQTSNPLFWISTGAFIFFSGSLPYFIFMNYLIKNNIAMAIALFNILLILNTFMYSLYLIAFLCNPHSQK